MVNKTIITDCNTVCLVGGAAASPALISAINKRVDALVAVDGGADTLLQAGLTPRAVIGDLDSLSETAREKFAEQLWHIPEQSSTDFEKALTRIDAQTVIALGFTGGRLDHQLSVLSVMRRHAQRRVFVVDEYDVSTLVGVGQTTLHLPAGTRVSVTPITPAKVSLAGVQWPFADQPMEMAGFTSPSNAALGGDVTLMSDAPVLLTLPQEFLPTLLQAVVREK
ncbi:thiamine diphosphokinase [Yoonia sp.]|uniref:thiamine diphosphokinase n=1 Tax=Yoonia sp. TaxID=2212373 RepID=UPI0023B3703F